VLCDWPTKQGAIHAVYPPTRHLAARVRLFTDFLAERIGKEPYWDRGLGLAGSATPVPAPSSPATSSKMSMPD